MSAADPKRREMILARRAKGDTYVKIAADLGISYQRVAQIATKAVAAQASPRLPRHTVAVRTWPNGSPMPCASKEGHLSAKAAQISVDRNPQNYCRPYRCVHCEQWHVTWRRRVASRGVSE